MIDGQDYIDRITAINMQTSLALKAIQGFLNSQDAVDTYLKEELETTRKFTEEAAKSAKFDLSKHWVFSDEGSEKYLNGIKETLPTQIEGVINRINQNKLLLLVTVFESFMKDIHREILRINPKALKADRQVPLGKIVSTPIEEILEEEIEREVQSLDRKTIEQRCEYFDKHLNIDWFGGTIIPLLKPVLDLRNKITHEDPDITITDNDLGLTYLVTFSLPVACVMQASVLYPEAFKWSDEKLDGMKKILEQQGRIKT